MPILCTLLPAQPADTCGRKQLQPFTLQGSLHLLCTCVGLLLKMATHRQL